MFLIIFTTIYWCLLLPSLAENLDKPIIMEQRQSWRKQGHFAFYFIVDGIILSKSRINCKYLFEHSQVLDMKA